MNVLKRRRVHIDAQTKTLTESIFLGEICIIIE